MQSKSYSFNHVEELVAQQSSIVEFAPSLLIVYAAPSFFENDDLHSLLKALNVNFIGCSTAGEIVNKQVSNNSISLVAIHFETNAKVKIYTQRIDDMCTSFETGIALSSCIEKAELKGIYLLSPGLGVNGSALINGLSEHLPASIGVSGGLAGDNGDFNATYVLGPEGISSSNVVAVGFYGEHLQFGYGASGGWRSFGPARQITRAKENVLCELDDKPALDIYKHYLGEYAKDLPSIGLLFPFEKLSETGQPTGLIRTILGVEEKDKTLVLAGGVSEQQYLRLMHASSDDLIDGATAAVKIATSNYSAQDSHQLVLITSCVGRKLVMGDRVEEEIEEVERFLPQDTAIAGFYSYGELCPFSDGAKCELHNQTLTIMLLREIL